MKLNNSELDASYRRSIRQQALERHGVVESRCSVTVTVYGPVVLQKNGHTIEYVKTLWNLGEAAVLSQHNLDGMEVTDLPEGCDIITCENESPFSNMVRQRHPG